MTDVSGGPSGAGGAVKISGPREAGALKRAQNFCFRNLMGTVMVSFSDFRLGGKCAYIIVFLNMT